ncbi:Endo/exonuclease/phosphatase domain-containing protein [Fusarium falciforme]|uniref:Endonuclease/exonuclease/phosphatase domain-containing protein n=1 Tax=Fusarium falciforme TaxID=195108 RepID=A0A9W8UZ22_9HYPO|nr:Endo/exonuclease/phosphatase domain-containing protein [Fusarium falciforme]KAJ4182859.1 hypothetical protein NW755_010058 [Fusarium falciforme]KAJ4184699.1 hypothetical protein NW767_013130 [Fusarium falciforme]KAJ4245352.1 hypothetical protein NW757_010008 [Fusarium falciforme]WAO82986.1 Endo/exonuclease/phosphatase domain-containing protein [Fusarium falciforme]
MYFPKRLLAVISAILFLTLSANANKLEPEGGVLQLVEDAPRFTFDYETRDPHEKNWIGLYYEAGQGLIPNWGEQYTKNSVSWKYAPKSKGRVTLETKGLKPGRYSAFFHARDKYVWLAPPFDVFITKKEEHNLEFVVDEITLPDARGGDSYSVTVAGLIRGGNKGVKFYNGTPVPNWLWLSTDGTISGQPFRTSKAAEFVVWAKRGNSVASLKVKIGVRSRTEVKVPQLRVMTYNLWFGGGKFKDYHDKQLRFIVNSKADIIGIQEDGSGERAKALAEALGWHYWASKVSHSILSKYPIQVTSGNINRSGGARIELDGDWQTVNFWVAHLNYKPYGPYDFCYSGMKADKVMQREYDSGRPTQIEDTLKAMKYDLRTADIEPLFLVGDFNAPSHLDWTDKRKKKNCGQGKFNWPTSMKPTEAGMIDSYRVAHPDPDQDEGITYGPITPWNKDWGKEEPNERLDFIYYKGAGLEVVDSWVMKPPNSGHPLDEWTSDHSAVMTLFNISEEVEIGDLRK